MSTRRVAIVGSGMIGSILAHDLVGRGCRVDVFERGAPYAYPHAKHFRDAVLHQWSDPAESTPSDLAHLTQGGSYTADLASEAVVRVGGAGSAWSALATRMTPVDFRTRSARGFGDDWPITYDDLEPWYGLAEERIGVAGTDADNPWAPPRSRPYPLPAFGLTDDDRMLAERLRVAGIHLHTTPQARTRRAWDGRPACLNVGECQVCPTGARYSPNHHLARATATGRCRLHSRTTVRRVLADRIGRVRALLVRAHDEPTDREHPADVVVVAGAAFESARLLLLSRDARHPDGLGNNGGHVGRHLSFHHIWSGHMHYRERLHPGQVGYWTGQSDQFCDPPGRGTHGGVKIELPSRAAAEHARAAGEATSFAQAMERFEVATRCRLVAMHAESAPSDGKFVALSTRRDRFGDPFAHVHYDSSEFDRATHAFSRELFERVARATGAIEHEFAEIEGFGAFAHFMGTCRMGRDAADSVADSFGAVHDTPGLFTLGLGGFVGSGGAVNPTLTAIALALRAGPRVAADAS